MGTPLAGDALWRPVASRETLAAGGQPPPRPPRTAQNGRSLYSGPGYATSRRSFVLGLSHGLVDSKAPERACWVRFRKRPPGSVPSA
jgi:hypothetical protein